MSRGPCAIAEFLILVTSGGEIKLSVHVKGRRFYCTGESKIDSLH